MVEGGVNQRKITQKRKKVEEIVEEDRISALSDGLLLEILSRLPTTKSAIRTGTLSKRWKNLWTWVPTLIFIEDYDNLSPSLVDKTLAQCRQLKLREFVVGIRYDIRFKSQISNWIDYAISCNVEELALGFSNLGLEAGFPLNESVFMNSCFTDLILQGCIFSPNGAISWKSLRSLCISEGNLSEDLIENILFGSHMLETLTLDECYGYKRLDITSKSVKKLVFRGYSDPRDEFMFADVIEINAPHILSIKIHGQLWCWKLVLLDVSSLVEADLDYKKVGHSLLAQETSKEVKEEMLKGLIQSLRHVKEIKVGDLCFKVMDRLKAKGWSFRQMLLPDNASVQSRGWDYVLLRGHEEDGYKFEELMEEEDRISTLPDRIIVEILARLPTTKSAIRTSTLSKRWRYLWTLVPTLNFTQEYDNLQPSDFVSFVNKTLTQCLQPKLRKFIVNTNYDIRFESQVNNWIDYAISCNVEEFELWMANPEHDEFMLNEDFFINSSFTDLRLSCCIFNPKGEINWERLRFLYIGSAYLNEDVIEKILFRSPQLEFLALEYCYGFRRLDITSKSVKKFVLSGYVDPYDESGDPADIIEINAPNITFISIQGHLELWKVLLLNVSSLVEANLYFTKGGHFAETTSEEAEEEMFKGFLRSLRRIKGIKINASCYKDVRNQVMLEKYDPDIVVHPPANKQLLEQRTSGSCCTSRAYPGSTFEVQRLKDKIKEMELELEMFEVEWKARYALREAKMKEMLGEERVVWEVECEAVNARWEGKMKEMQCNLNALKESLASRFLRHPPS